MIARLIIFGLLALVLQGCGQGARHATDADIRAALNLITDERLKAHVEFLSDDGRAGRLSGEPGYDAAAAYVAERFQAMGVAPAGTDGWFQPVEPASLQD